MRSADEILHAIDSDLGIAYAIIAVYQEAIQRNTGQHDVDRCRICHRDELYHTDVLIHKEDCPVGKAERLLREFEKTNPQVEG